MVEAAVKKMEAQLKLWTLNIDHLSAEAQVAGVQARFDTLMRIDELKALHAIAQSKIEKFKAADVPERTTVQAEMKAAWKELEAAFKHLKP